MFIRNPGTMLAAFAILSLSIRSTPAFGDVSIASPGGLSASLSDQSGAYTVTSSNPEWSFSGTLGTAVSNAVGREGSDGAGAYKEIAFSYNDGAAVDAQIRLYSHAAVAVFIIVLPDGRAGWGTAFPSFTAYPKLPYAFGHNNSGFTEYSFVIDKEAHNRRRISEQGPCMFFDDNNTAFLISPAANFIDAEVDYYGPISSGIKSREGTFLAGYTHRTILVAGAGVSNVLMTWGKALTGLFGKVRPVNDADVSLNRIGYWTSNGAPYYYKFESQYGYAGTLQKVKQRYDDAGVELGYLQLDSWWYPKGPDRKWDVSDGAWEYIAHPDLFPDGLKGFTQSLGIPLMTHHRWVDEEENNPYRQRFEMSRTHCIDPAFWDEVLAYEADGGVEVYEQDWLTHPLSNTLGHGDLFLDNMARACAQHNIAVFYVMPTACHLLQTTRYDNLRIFRTAGDKFTMGLMWDFVFGAGTCKALGIYPCTDNFRSTSESNILLAVLSAGTVGPADKLGEENFQLLKRAVRRDGVIVKPDVPLAPIDEVYLACGKTKSLSGKNHDFPMIAYTYSDHGNGKKIVYVFTSDRDVGNGFAQYTPSMLDIGSGDVYLYDFRTGTGKRIAASETYRATMEGNISYQVMAKPGASGIAFFGDKSMYATAGTKRIAKITETGDQVVVRVIFARGEQEIELFGFAGFEVKTSPSGNSRIDNLTYDAASGMFTFKLILNDASHQSSTQAWVAIGKNPSIPVEIAGLPGLFSGKNLSSMIQYRRGILSMTAPSTASWAMELVDCKGRIVKQKTGVAGLTPSLKTAAVPDGVYMIRILSNGKDRCGKVWINNARLFCR